ncbi:hypothetical protein ACFFS2_13795 [Streptomyces aurantiacus]|uniref:Uncharacterized protein n=1 Tax=Streptomyces aurantiacus TaxID=47760 RepID=A0A7G1NTP6_9ACTN|nr:hypothetical protein [Streptomyces aurantiacus]BCL25841.1 hypothetical protein GCM10017557_07000 [Streptomyces aurantiacus]
MRTLHEAVAQCRTLVVEGPDGISRSPLLAELARAGFMIRHSRGRLHHVDPTRPYRELLAAPGPLALDGAVIHELVYGPLRRGHSRVTWIQALDFAEAVAERQGALLHLTDSGRKADSEREADTGHEADTESAEAAAAYDRAFRTLAQHVPVVVLDARNPGPPIRAPDAPAFQLGRYARKLTVSW